MMYINCVYCVVTVLSTWPFFKASKAQYSQFVLKMLLNPNQSIIFKAANRSGKVIAYVPQLAVIWLSCKTKTINVWTMQFGSVKANKLELTTSIVPWCNPDTRTIPTQTENVAVPFGLRARFDCALVTV